MIQFRKDRILLLFLLTIGFTFASSSVFAQANDSVAQGVIKVRRSQVPSVYTVKMSYSYGSSSRVLFSWGRKSGKSGGRQEQDAVYSPPDPVRLEPNLNDSNQTLLDSSYIIGYYNARKKPAEEFPWEEWLNQNPHTFEWDDTSGIDSVSFDLEINARGQMRIRSYAHQGDSSSIALAEKLLPVIKKLWLWYPASMVTNDGSKVKKVSCVVRMKVYAVKLGYGQNLPLKIVD